MKLYRILKSFLVASLLTVSLGALGDSNFNIVDEHHQAVSSEESEGHGPLMVALYALDYSYEMKGGEKLLRDIVYYRADSDTDSSPWSVKIEFKTTRSEKSKVITILGHYESTGDGEGYGYGGNIADGYWTVVKKQRKFISLR